MNKPFKKPSHSQVSLVSLANASNEILTSWTQLVEAKNFNATLLPEWTKIIANAYDVIDSTDVLLVGKRKLEFVAPIIQYPTYSLKIPINTLGMVANLVSYHHQIVSSIPTVSTIEALVTEATRRNIDCIHLEDIVDDSDLGMYLKTHTSNSLFYNISEPGDTSPFLPIESTWDELLKGKSKKFRYKLRKRTEVLDASNIKMKWFTDPECCTELLKAMQIIEENSWKKCQGHSIFDSNIETRYHKLLLPFLAQQKAMFANVLYRDDSPIAYNFCCNNKGWVGQLKTSFDMRHADISPGSIVIDQAIKHAICIGAYEFDFLGDTDPHKLAWSKSVRKHTNYRLYLNSSLKGRYIGLVKNIHAKFSSLH